MRLVVVLLALTACGDNKSVADAPLADASVEVDTPALAFLTAPSFSFPSNDAPLSGRIALETNRPTRVSVRVGSATRTFDIVDSTLATTHVVPILELRADTAHQLVVTATDEDGQRLIADPIDVMAPDVPSFAPTFTTTQLIPGAMEPGVTLAAIQTFVLAVDLDGAYVWFVDLGRPVVDVTRLEGGTFLVLFDNRTSAAEIDAYGATVREWRAANVVPAAGAQIPVAVDSFHHELAFLTNGDLLTLSTERRTFSNYPTSETDPTPRSTPTDIVGDVVSVFGTDGTVRARHSLLDALDPFRVGYNSFGNFWSTFYQPAGALDWSHGNGVVLDSDGGFVVSLRHQDALVKFDAGGALRWILGTHDNWTSAFASYLLTPVGAPFAFAFHQHAPLVLPNRNLLVFDNGNFRVSPPTPGAVVTYSRAVEYAVDSSAMEVRQVWEFDAGQTIFAGATGDVDVGTSTGNVIVTFGTSGKLVEVTHTTPPIEVFRMQTSGSFYRTERVPSLNP